MVNEKSQYDDLKQSLAIDCAHCCGLCCVALYFAKTEGFSKDKPAGKPCHHLQKDFRCAIHAQLSQQKLKGCLAYDCFGAGQKVTQSLYNDNNWQASPQSAQQMFAVFSTVFQLHQMLWYLLEAVDLSIDQKTKMVLENLIGENQHLTSLAPEQLASLDIAPYRQRVNEQLKSICVQMARKCQKGAKANDYIGRNFKKGDLRGRDFSMTLMIAADLEGCQLQGANFLGADMRDVNIKNTDLSQCLFLTQGQINHTKGNSQTKLPSYLKRPESW